MSRLTFFGLTAMLVMMSSPSFAGERDAIERAARKACMAGEYAKGVDLLADLFVDTKDATYIFNQGRCYEQNGRHAEASTRFREYLRKAKNLDKSERAEVERHIAECEALQVREHALATPAVETRVPVASPIPPTPVVPVEPPVTVERRVSDEDNHTAGKGLRVAGIVSVLIGVAGIGTGILCQVKANGLAAELGRDNTYSRGTQSSYDNYVALGWVGYGVGTAGLAGGALLYYLGWQAGSARATSVTFLPVLAPGAVGAVAGGTF